MDTIGMEARANKVIHSHNSDGTEKKYVAPH